MDADPVPVREALNLHVFILNGETHRAAFVNDAAMNGARLRAGTRVGDILPHELLVLIAVDVGMRDAQQYKT